MCPKVSVHLDSRFWGNSAQHTLLSSSSFINSRTLLCLPFPISLSERDCSAYGTYSQGGYCGSNGFICPNAACIPKLCPSFYRSVRMPCLEPFFAWALRFCLYSLQSSNAPLFRGTLLEGFCQSVWFNGVTGQVDKNCLSIDGWCALKEQDCMPLQTENIWVCWWQILCPKVAHMFVMTT